MRCWEGLSALVLLAASARALNPREYEQQVAKCKAVNRAEDREVELDIREQHSGFYLHVLIP